MALSKLELLFGTPVPEIDITSDVEVREFFVAELAGRTSDRGEMDEMRAAVRAVLAAQILDEEPLGVWETASRLVDHGLDRVDVIDQMTMVLLGALRRTFDDDGPFDEEQYRADLAALPLPSVDAVVAELGVLARHQGCTRAEAAELVIGAAGASTPIAQATVARIVDKELELGSLLWELPDGRVVHLPTLTDGRMFTHRIDQVERELDALVGIGRDLAAFAGRSDLSTPEGAPVGVEFLAADQIAWFGPDGWLAEVPADGLVAVRVDADGVVHVAPFAEPEPADTAVTGTLAAVAQAQITEVPVSLEQLVVAALLAEPELYRDGGPPLTDSCEAAGLLVDGTEVATSPEQWAEARRRDRIARLEAALGIEEAPLAVEYLAAFEEASDPVAIRRALVGMVARQEHGLAQVVVDELIAADDPSPEEIAAARAVAVAGLEAATDAPQQMAAHWLAGVIEERSGDAVAASAAFEQALEADTRLGVLLDRAAWYAYERGDASVAASRWAELVEPDPDELASARQFAAPPGAKLGRNDPCWCGSGRKYKACHLGSPEQRPLSARYLWLYRKSISFLRRHGKAPREVVYDLCEELAQDPSDAMSLAEAFADPLVFDAALAEAELFEEFVAARAELLPDDEAELARRWLGVTRQVHKLPTGDLVCGRLVPVDLDEQRFEFLPGVFVVSPDHRSELEAVCAEGDPHELCRWARENR